MGNIGLHLETCFGSCDLPLDSRSEEFELIEGLRTGKEQAYEALIQRYQQPVYNLIFRLLNDPADANDVVQEVFLKVFRNVGSFRGQSSLKTWVYRIAVNEAHNHRRWFPGIVDRKSGWIGTTMSAATRTRFQTTALRLFRPLSMRRLPKSLKLPCKH